jgi:hypothetical protein
MATLFFQLFDSVNQQTWITPHFSTGSVGDAETVAQSVATLLGRSVILVPLWQGVLGPYTAYAPGSQGDTCPSPNNVSY